MNGRLVFSYALGLMASGCGEAPVVPSTGDGALGTPTEAGPTRYEISDGSRVVGVAEVGADGRPSFTVAPGLPSPCLADGLAEGWKNFEWPETIFVDASYYDPDTKTHYSMAAEFDQASADYPLAVVDAFLSQGYKASPSIPLDRRGTREGPPKLPATFGVTADRLRGEAPENFTGLPLGSFTVNADGTISLATACEGEYLASRLEKHFAQEELVVSFSQPGGRWNIFAKREPGDLRVTTGDDPDVQIRYQHGEPEYFAALMTVVDRGSGVPLNVDPAPSLSVSYP